VSSVVSCAEQASQAGEPASGWKKPMAQSAQVSVLPVAENSGLLRPAGHAEQASRTSAQAPKQEPSTRGALQRSAGAATSHTQAAAPVSPGAVVAFSAQRRQT
jgi:hypothetical protein